MFETPGPLNHVPMSDRTESRAALGAVRVLDLVDERGIYGVKLLADLGADVVRVEPPGGDPLRKRGPFHAGAGGERHSLWYAFFGSNRRFATLDLATNTGRRQLRKLTQWADVIVDSGGLLEGGLEPDSLLGEKPALVIVEVSSFGPEGPWKDYLAPDLVAGALGGFCATTGDVDTPPLKGYGELNFVVSGSYTAIAALSALRHARETGEGQVVEVRVHEAIASCLEQVFMWLWYHEHLPMAEGPVLQRRGSLHWTNAFQVVPAKGGSIMVTPTPKPEAQLAWLAEEGAQQDLLDPKWQQPEQVFQLLEALLNAMREWVATKQVEEFFFAAQERHSPYGWVLPLDRIATNPQLEARDWWTEYRLGGNSVRGPGAPYRLSETPWREPRPQTEPGSDTATVLSEIGWDDE